MQGVATQPVDLERLKDYFERLEDVSFAYLFGSYARGQAGPLSDIDVAVHLKGSSDKSRCYERRLTLIGDLMGVLETNEVDVVILNETPPALNYRVFRDGVLLACQDRQTRIEFQARTVSEYLDFLPIIERHGRAILEAARKGKLFNGYDPHRGSLERHRRLRESLKAKAEPERG